MRVLKWMIRNVFIHIFRFFCVCGAGSSEFCVNLLAVIAGHQHLGRRQLEWPAVVKQKRLRKKLEGIRLFAFLDDSTMLKNLIVT